MTERIIDLAEEPARLNVRNHCLVIAREEQPEITIPLGEVAALALSNPRVSLTHAALAGLAEAGAVVIVCNDKHMPAAMLLPLEAHFIQSERFALQTQAPLPLRKRLWQSVVRAKIRAQARVLTQVRGGDAGLPLLIPKVRSGDPGNVEGEAARRYWQALFADRAFRRSRSGGDQNVLLNYGYAVLRAIIARAICASGLHPSIGLHHHNRYDAFCLADDLMEPFRPLVDRTVVTYCDCAGADTPLDKAAKMALVGTLMGRFTASGEERTLFDIAGRVAADLVGAFSGKRRSLVFPEL